MKATIAALLSVTVLLLPYPVWSQQEEQPAVLTPSDMGMDKAVPDCKDMNTGILVNIQPVSLKSSYVRKKFDGYQVTVTNAGNSHVSVDDAHVANSMETTEVRKEVHKGLIGITSFMGVSGFFTTALRRSIKNKKAMREADSFDAYIQPAVLRQGETLSTRALIRKNETPKLNLTVSDNTTGEVLCRTAEPGRIMSGSELLSIPLPEAGINTPETR